MRYPAAATLVVFLSAACATASAQRFASGSTITTLPAPVTLDNDGRFQSTFARVGEDLFLAGEPALVAQLGMTYVYLPVRGNAEYRYSPRTFLGRRLPSLRHSSP